MITTTPPTIRIRSRAQFLSLPCQQFGYVPTESLVAMRLGDGQLRFQARLDLAELLLDPTGILEQLGRAAVSFRGPREHWHLFAYTEHPHAWAPVLDGFAARLGEVHAVYATDGRESFEILDGVAAHPEPCELDLRTEDGVPVSERREDVVAAVHRWHPSEALVARARGTVEGADDALRLELLQDLVEQPAVTGAAAALLARLLAEEECFAEYVCGLGQTVAEARRAQLLHALEEAPAEARPAVLALVALCSWLAGDGTMANEALSVLYRDTDGHPLGAVVATMLDHGIPPARWDEG